MNVRTAVQAFIDALNQGHIAININRRAAADLIEELRSALAADTVEVPREPTEEMKRAGGHANSEWLNDNAPIGESLYAMPMESVWRAMIDAAQEPSEGGGKA